MLVGVGYQTLQSLLLDFYKWLPSPSERLLHALLSMLVDGKFEINEITTIKASNFHILEPINMLLSFLGPFTSVIYF